MQFDTLWNSIADVLGTIPDRVWVSLLAVMATAFAVVLALVIHGLIFRLARRALAARHPFLDSILIQMRRPLRFAFILLALNIAAAAAPIGPPVGPIMARALQVALIAFLGWMSVTAINIGAVLYLQRFNITTADNLLARKHVTQVRILRGALNTLIVVIATAAALMTFQQVRQFGVSLFASAGIAGIVVGLAARPMLSNLIAGLQLAITQPIRIDDAVIVEGEFGNIEEITSTYVVVRLWDWRRMIVPLTNFIEKPFQNWTREGAQIIGSVTLYLDYSAPVDQVREKVSGIARESKLWDGQVIGVQVTDCKEETIEVRVLVSAQTSGAAFDLRCEVREKLIDFLQREYPQALPRKRQQVLDSQSRVIHLRDGSGAERHVGPERRYGGNA
jgi:small-conductance mechanosensitive channel